MPEHAAPPSRALNLIVPLLLMVMTLLHVYRSPANASGLEPIPDSLEYALGARHLARTGQYNIRINQTAYPPRYPPWFSIILAPFYAVAPGQLGVGVLATQIFAVIAVLAAFTAGRQLAGLWGGALAAVILLHSAEFEFWSRYIMTDVPVAATELMLLGLYLWPKRSWQYFLGAGALCAIAGGMRGLAYALVIPFAIDALRQRPRRWLNLSLAISPAILLMLATAIYNQRTFGSISRTGYQFWCPVPYDYISMVFSPRYLGENSFTLLMRWPLLLPAVLGAMFLGDRRPGAVGRPLIFIALALTPLLGAHLLYFVNDPRFFLPLFSIGAVLAGAGIAAVLPLGLQRRAWLVPLVVLVTALLRTRTADAPSSYRRDCAEQINRNAPKDAVIVSAIDPVYLTETVLPGTTRRIVPITRSVEYASKAVAWKRIPVLSPPADAANDHRAPGLFAGGAFDPIPFTADEDPDRLVALAAAGTPVYVDLNSMQSLPAAQQAGLLLQRRLDALQHRSGTTSQSKNTPQMPPPPRTSADAPPGTSATAP